jgi:hypothetical protein
VLLLAAFALQDNCSGDDSVGSVTTTSIGDPRSFLMGLTPFAPGPGEDDQQLALDFVLDNAGLAALHYDEIGLPWEALEQNRFPPSFVAKFEDAAERTEGRVIYTAITPLNAERSGIAINSDGGPFPAAMGPALFSNPRLRQAFINYGRFILETFQPRYLALGIEINLYALHNPADFENLASLYLEAYAALKPLAPSTSFFPTLQADALIGYNQFELLPVLDPAMDRLALALYPSSVGFEPSTLPDDYISRFRAFTERPIVIAETGFGSRPFNGEFDAAGSELLQRDYLAWILNQAENHSFEFVVWFFPTDVPWILSTLSPDRSDFAFFAFMGLTTQDFAPKPVTDLWNENLRRPYQPRP